MKKLKKLFLLACLVVGVNCSLKAAEPAMTLHTTIYQSSGEDSTFSMLFGATSAGVGQTITVDDGTGEQEYVLQSANYDSSSDSSTGTYVTCSATEEGIVKVYMDDPGWIDWLNCDGCYIDSIDLGDMTNLFYLSLSNNELKSLDLSKYQNIQALYLTNNEFDESPLVIGPKPYLYILEINGVGALSPDFTLTDYPTLYSFCAWNASGLTSVDASNCPDLVQISVDGTDVSYLDVSQNPKLSILNVSDTKITELDLSNNPALTQLYCTHEATKNLEYKINSLDLSHNPELFYLFCTGNNLTELDITNNTKLGSVTARKNKLTHINVENNPNLYCLNISGNYFDFTTLPEPNSQWTEYDYQQADMPMSKSYPVGESLDFSKKVIREGTTTEGALYAINEDAPLDILPIDLSCYTYKDGVITLDAVPTYNGAAVDSVYCQFTNTLFSEYPLKTAKFKVKKAEEYGKPLKMLNFTCGVSEGKPLQFAVGMGGASATEPKKLYVNLGDGNLTEFTVTSPLADEVNIDALRKGGANIEVYIDEDDYISALAISDMQLYSIDLSELRAMQTLKLVNTGLYSLNTQWNRSLQEITVTGNNFYSFSLATDVMGYSKNALRYADLSNNGMQSFTWNENFTVEDLNLSHNKLSELSLSKNTVIEKLDVSYNNFDYLNTQECSALTELNVSNNVLTQLLLPTDGVLSSLNVSGNKFTLATLPSYEGLAEYVYAPQADYTIPAKGPGVNLSSQYLNGTTTYTWKKANGTVLEAGSDYTESEGSFSFIKPALGKVYCEMTNSELPDFSGENVYKTTQMETSGMPEHVIASFVTANDGDEAILTLTSLTEGNTVFVDWTGDFDLVQYDLATTYTPFTATTTANAVVKVYSYEEENNVSVFTLRNAELKSMDASAMKQLICFGVTNGGLKDENISYPESPNLGEMLMQGNKLSSFDFSRYPNLYYLNLAENSFKEFTLPDNTNVQQLMLSGNQMTKLDLGNNSKLWALYAEDNELTNVEFTGVPNITQMTFANNKLSEIDLSPISNLNVLSIVGNRFTYVTLPRLSEINPNNSSPVYYYGNQANLDVEVVDGKSIDLSEQASVDGTETSFTWIIGLPEYDDDGNLINEVLNPAADICYADSEEESDSEEEEVEPDYEIQHGYTTFYTEFEDVVCLMYNEVFENLVLKTNPVSVNVSGVEKVSSEALANAYAKVKGGSIYVGAPAGISINVYDTAGRVVASRTSVEGETVISGLSSAVYIVRLGNKAAKVIVK